MKLKACRPKGNLYLAVDADRFNELAYKGLLTDEEFSPYRREAIHFGLEHIEKRMMVIYIKGKEASMYGVEFAKGDDEGTYRASWIAPYMLYVEGTYDSDSFRRHSRRLHA